MTWRVLRILAASPGFWYALAPLAILAAALAIIVAALVILL